MTLPTINAKGEATRYDVSVPRRRFVESVHGHRDIGELDAGAVGLDADLDAVVDVGHRRAFCLSVPFVRAEEPIMQRAVFCPIAWHA